MSLFECFVGLLWTLALLNEKCQSLKDVRVSVPTAIRKGETAVFLCDFDLEGDSLYSVKWYKGRREFYRFTPKDEHPIKVFHIDKLQVDTTKSNMTQLTLLRVEPSISGKYNCEVSAESPSFHTALVSGEMDVVEIPYQSPVISGMRSKYRAGELFEANCTSGGSKPAANLTWFLNDEPVNRDFTYDFNQIKDYRDPTLLISSSKLSLTLKSHSFNSGRLKIRCSANIHHIYRQSAEKVAEEERTKTNAGTTEVVVLPPKFFEENSDTNTDKRRLDLVGFFSASARIHSQPIYIIILLLVRILR